VLHFAYQLFEEVIKVKNKIRVRRAELDLSQQELAENTGLSRITILNIEKEKNNPKGETMVKIANALQITIEELFFLPKS